MSNVDSTSSLPRSDWGALTPDLKLSIAPFVDRTFELMLVNRNWLLQVRTYHNEYFAQCREVSSLSRYINQAMEEFPVSPCTYCTFKRICSMNESILSKCLFNQSISLKKIYSSIVSISILTERAESEEYLIANFNLFFNGLPQDIHNDFIEFRKIIDDLHGDMVSRAEAISKWMQINPQILQLYTELSLSKEPEFQISHLPWEINWFTNIRILDLSHQQLSELPEVLPPHLMVIKLEYNRFKALPKVFFKIPPLKEVKLDKNEIEEIPGAFVEEFARCKFKLSLAENKIQKAPPYLHKFVAAGRIEGLKADTSDALVRFDFVENVMRRRSCPTTPNRRNSLSGSSKPRSYSSHSTPNGTPNLNLRVRRLTISTSETASESKEDKYDGGNG